MTFGIEVKKNIILIAGTRPEAIKLAPVYLNLKMRGIDVHYLPTGQHCELHDQVIKFFGIKTLEAPILPSKQRDLSSLCSELMQLVNKNLKNKNYTHVVVQGDTASAFCGANVAFLNKIPVLHVEAGLRTGRVEEPFPEELFRRMISITADAHFCPTIGAYENLVNEGIDKKKLHLTGNTVVDAIRIARETDTYEFALRNELGKVLYGTLVSNSFIIVTIGRRENHGRRLDQICDAIISFSRKSDTHILCPIHPNPEVRERVIKKLSGEEKIHLVPALSYPAMVWALKSCKFVMSDSGGLQEEVPSFQKRILILRDQTERPEIITSGWGKLIGTNTGEVTKAMHNFDGDFARASPDLENPFGNGFASDLICDVISKS